MSIQALLARREVEEAVFPTFCIRFRTQGDVEMRYLMIVKGDENFSASGPPPQELMDAIGQLGIEAAKTGKIVSMGGLQPTSKGASVRISGGKMTVRDGPFSEAKEVIGGFTIMELASKEEAIEEAKKFMELHQKLWPAWDGECEVRLMYADGDHP
jgi:hypothetical protein